MNAGGNQLLEIRGRRMPVHIWWTLRAIKLQCPDMQDQVDLLDRQEAFFLSLPEASNPTTHAKTREYFAERREVIIKILKMHANAAIHKATW